MGFFRLPKDKKGYQFFKDKNGNHIRVHKRVCEKKYGQIPKGFIVHHIDGDKSNNKPDNLILLHPKDHYRVHVKKDLRITQEKEYIELLSTFPLNVLEMALKEKEQELKKENETP